MLTIARWTRRADRWLTRHLSEDALAVTGWAVAVGAFCYFVWSSQ